MIKCLISGLQTVMGNKFHIHAPFTSVHADMTLDNFPWTDPLMRIDTKN